MAADHTDHALSTDTQRSLQRLEELAARNAGLSAPDEAEALHVAIRSHHVGTWLTALRDPEACRSHLVSTSAGGAGQDYWYDTDARGVHVRRDYGAPERLVRWPQLVKVMASAWTKDLLEDADRWSRAWGIYHASQPPFWLPTTDVPDEVRQADRERSLDLHRWATTITDTLTKRALDTMVVQETLF